MVDKDPREIVEKISEFKSEPQWMLDLRLLGVGSARGGSGEDQAGKEKEDGALHGVSPLRRAWTDGSNAGTRPNRRRRRGRDWRGSDARKRDRL